ncbi:uncharacterized protein LOC132309255 [Cornus florida]|uniref:uncharacterized protein LOC132309255 n=1 Tax=Cornus florida TaxID=4283 RepID=UPI0028A25A68|nr:uncharacterized protein LOC132309255 [Cornus florida]
MEIDLPNLPSDPGLRTRIIDYSPNIQDQIRRAYILKGLCQPRKHKFPQKKFGQASALRRFIPDWFNDYSNWLEYSISKDALFCLHCYLFKHNIGEQSGGDSFVSEGFSNWKKKDRLQIHVGEPNNAHNQAWNQYEALKNQNQHIQTIMFNQSDQTRIDYRKRLTTSIDCIRYLLEQGLAFHGHDEYEHSSNQGNFPQLLKFFANHNEDVKSEQMAVVFRYVNMDGDVIECFRGVEHVTSTTALSLKMAIDELFCRHGLSITRLRGQGYDGASNMQGKFNGLKTLILKENECAFYVHCFAHQLQLALVKVAKSHVDITTFFSYVANVVNVVGASCKRRDILHEKQATMVIEALNNGEIESGRGLNQNTTLKDNLHRPPLWFVIILGGTPPVPEITRTSPIF